MCTAKTKLNWKKLNWTEKKTEQEEESLWASKDIQRQIKAILSTKFISSFQEMESGTSNHAMAVIKTSVFLTPFNKKSTKNNTYVI